MQGISIIKNLRIGILATLLTMPTLIWAQGVVITETAGTSTPHASSILDVRSTDKGMLIPRLTTDERLAIASPANGLLVFDTNENSFFYYDATKGGWVGVINYNPEPAADEPIFVVRNSDGDIVFAVYEKGVRMYVEDDAKDSKGNKSGFAIGGLTGFKQNETEYFRVTPDSVRIYLREPTVKGNKGGFAIGGLTGFKADTVALMFVAHDSTRFYIDTEETTGGGKGNKGGFAIGGLTGFKKLPEEYLRVTRDSTRVYVNTDAIPDKGNKSGFAIGGLTGLKADPINFMFLKPENYFIGHEAGGNTTPGVGSAGKFNTFFGYKAGKENVDGHSNVFIGNKSGFNNMGDISIDQNVGSRNVFIGFESGYSNQLGGDNIMFGYRSGYKNTHGGNNICIGSRAGFSNQQQSQNIFIGLEAGFFHSGIGQNTANNNIFIGSEAGYGSENQSRGQNNVYIGNKSGKNSTLATDNVFVGYQSGKSISEGSSNVYVGDNTGADMTTGNRNTFVGTSAGLNAIGGNRNIFMGYEAGKKHNQGDRNVYIGYGSGVGNTSYNEEGYDNVFVGTSSGQNNGTGYQNVFIGLEAGNNNRNGYNNTAIGYRSGPTTGSSNINNSISIGNMAQNNASNQVVIGNADINSVIVKGIANASTTEPPNVYIDNDGQLMKSTSTGGGSGGVTGTGEAGKLAVWDGATSITYYENLNWDNSNFRLGIGSLSPSYNISFNGNAIRTIGVERRAVGASANGVNFIISSGGTKVGASNASGGNLLLASGISTGIGSSSIHFQTVTAGTTGTADRNPTTKMSILGNGNVGIGTDNPGSQLHTTGTVRFASMAGTGSRMMVADENGNLSTTSENLCWDDTNSRLGVGTNTPLRALHVVGNAQFTGVGTASLSNTALYITSAGVLSTSTSDMRLKTNIEGLESSLKKVLRLRGVKFNWIESPNTTKSIGFIAQEVQPIIPEIVFTNEVDGYMGINYPEMTAVLVEAIKEQNQTIETQVKTIDQLQIEVTDLKARLERLERYMLSQEN